MFHISRSLYRRLAPQVAGESREAVERNRLRVLDACERTMRRLESEPHFARPERFLFEEIRVCLPITEQGWARKVIDFHVEVARQLVDEMPRDRVCPAFTRKGTPCQREPRPDSDYCPSHRHLEPLDEALMAETLG